MINQFVELDLTQSRNILPGQGWNLVISEGFVPQTKTTFVELTGVEQTSCVVSVCLLIRRHPDEILLVSGTFESGLGAWSTEGDFVITLGPWTISEMPLTPMALKIHTLTLRDLQVQHPYNSQYKTTTKDPFRSPLDAARTVNVRLVPASGYEIESSGDLGAPLLRAVCTTIREWMRECCRFGLLLQFKSTTIQRLEAGVAEVDVPINSKSCKGSWKRIQIRQVAYLLWW